MSSRWTTPSPCFPPGNRPGSPSAQRARIVSWARPGFVWHAPARPWRRSPRGHARSAASGSKTIAPAGTRCAGSGTGASSALTPSLTTRRSAGQDSQLQVRGQDRLVANLRPAAGRLARGSRRRRSSRPDRREQPPTSAPVSRARATSKESSGRPLQRTMTGAGPSTPAPPRRSSKHRQRKSRPERALPRSGQPQQRSAKSWTSPTLPAHKGATSWSSMTCAPPDTSSTQSPTACSTRARRPASARWSWPEHRGSEHCVDARPAKKCHETETELAWP